MSEIEKSNGPDQPSKQSDSDAHESKLSAFLQETTLSAISQSRNGGLDLSRLNDAQMDKVIEIAHLNEQNSFEYHNKKTEADKEVRLAEINSGPVIFKHFSRAALAIILFITIITLCILFFKDQYFNVWLSFLTGVFGGFGLSKMVPSKQATTQNPSSNQ